MDHNFKFLFCLLLLLNAECMFSQQSTLILKGRITDASGNSLPYAKITETQERKSTLSNQRGTFYLQVPAEKSILRISYIGYLTIDTTLYFKNDGRDTLSVSFRMTPAVKEFGVVTVSSEPYTQVFETTNLNILDYTFFGQNVLVLVNSKENYQVRLLDPEEKILTRQNLHFKPVSFVKDCLGILHILSTDSLYPVHFDSELFSFPDAIPMKDYVEFIEPCAASSDYFFFLKYVSDYGKTIQYISQKKIVDIYQTLRIVTDEAAVKDVYDYAAGLGMEFAPHPMGELNAITLKASYQHFQNETFFENVLTVPTYAPLIRTNSAVYIFDHLSDSCFVFSQDSEPIRTFFIDYHLKPSWANQLIVDEGHEKIYAVSELNGIYELAEINLETGQVNPPTQMVRHTYPQKIRIKDGWIYYLHHELNNPGYNKLYKVRLRDL